MVYGANKKQGWNKTLRFPQWAIEDGQEVAEIIYKEILENGGSITERRMYEIFDINAKYGMRYTSSCAFGSLHKMGVEVIKNERGFIDKLVLGEWEEQT